MNVNQEVKTLCDDIRGLGKAIRWLRRNQAKLEALPGGRYFAHKGGIDLDRLSHADVIKTIRTLGGKWKKSANTIAVVGETKIDYEAKFDGASVRCWGGEPPPSCRVIEVEEHVPAQVIPAHVKKVRKMICQPELSAKIAMAAEKVAS